MLKKAVFFTRLGTKRDTMDELDERLWDAMHVCKDEILAMKEDIGEIKVNARWLRYLLYVAILLGLVRLPFELWGAL